MTSEAQVAVIGGGPAGLMAAETLCRGGARVTVYDRMPAVGRKFLLAGRGGLNLTHSEALPGFLARYGAATPHLAASLAEMRDLEEQQMELARQLAANVEVEALLKAGKA